MSKVVKAILIMLGVSLALLMTAIGIAMYRQNIVLEDYADLGSNTVVSGGNSGVVLLLADKKNAVISQHLARLLGLAGKVVALVDVDHLLIEARKEQLSCINHVTLFDVYSQFLQQKYHFSHFSKPWLMGIGNGGIYTEMVMQQASEGIFAGAASWRRGSTALTLPAALCGQAASNIQVDSNTHVVDSLSAQPVVADKKSWLDSASSLQDWSRFSHAFFTQENSQAVDVADLPLIELPALVPQSPDYIAIIMSGDGGWANIDKDIAEALNRKSVAVLGWNSLRYFWQTKQPKAMAADLTTVISSYQQKWQKPKVLLIGFSLGADVMPFMFNGLSDAVKSNVIGMVLLSPSTTVDFQFHISDWLGSNSGVKHPLKPEIEKMQKLPVLCVYGKDDDDTACPALQQSATLFVNVLPGDHHFDGDYQAVVKLIGQHFNE